MEEVTANKKELFSELHNQQGSSLLEVLLVMSIVAILTPFLYGQIEETSTQIRNISVAKKIVKTRDSVLNFIRVNQDKWPDVAQIKMNDDDLKQITDSAHAGFIDKYLVRGAIATDVYLAFDIKQDKLQTVKIAKEIGTNAASVDDNGIAYGDSWAVSAPDFRPGDLIYRVRYNFRGDDISKYLHRGTNGSDGFNIMQRDLNMGKFDIYNIGTIAGESGKVKDFSAAFLDAKDVAASSVYFSRGANIDGNNVKIGSMRVSGDVIGFRNISAKKLNDTGFSTNGSVITDRATVSNSINIGKNLVIKSDSSKTISGFSGIIAHSIFTSFVYSDEMHFYNNFGLTVSGELLMSTVAPLKIGSWYFPSTTPPKFSELELSRSNMPAMPAVSDFNKLMQADWKESN